jgi:hypothetical protein
MKTRDQMAQSLRDGGLKPRSPARSSPAGAARAWCPGASRLRARSAPRTAPSNLLGAADRRLRRPRRARRDPRARPGRPRRQPHRPRLHRRPLRRLPVRGALARRSRQPAVVARATTACAARRLGHGRRALRPPGQPADARRARQLPAVRPRRELALLRRAEGDPLPGGLRLGRGAAPARAPAAPRPRFAHGAELHRAANRAARVRSCSRAFTSASRTPSPAASPTPMFDAVLARALALAA